MQSKARNVSLLTLMAVSTLLTVAGCDYDRDDERDRDRVEERAYHDHDRRVEHRDMDRPDEYRDRDRRDDDR